MYKIKLAPEADLEVVIERIWDKFGEDVETRKWNEIHRNVFLAVKHQRVMLFWILALIVALAALNVVNLLMMSSYHRKRDIAVFSYSKNRVYN